MNSDDYISGSRSPKPSHITLPKLAQPFPCMLDFLDARFPRVGREVWRKRLNSGDIRDAQGFVVDEATPYQAHARLSYFREVESEARIPFVEKIVYEDDEILVADKPHFLPVTPGGKYVNECLLYRLMASTGNEHLVPVHRLDRETAGLVLFSKRQATRSAYFALFKEGRIGKQYQAIASLPDALPDVSEQGDWLIESRIERSDTWIVFANVPGAINARSRIRLLESGASLGRFALSPLTGKTHQLRLHMGLIGSQILHDRLYPELLAFPDVPDYSNPLQLLAESLVFIDPVSGEKRKFESALRLQEGSL